MMNQLQSDQEIRQAREELAGLLDDLINRPLLDETRRIVGDNLYHLQSDIKAQGGGLRRSIDTNLTAINDDLGGAIDKVRSAISRVGDDFAQASSQTQQRLVVLEQKLEGLTDQDVARDERLGLLHRAQMEQGEASLKCLSEASAVHRLEAQTAMTRIATSLAGLADIFAEKVDRLQRASERERRISRLLAVFLLLNLVGTAGVLFKIF